MANDIIENQEDPLASTDILSDIPQPGDFKTKISPKPLESDPKELERQKEEWESSLRKRNEQLFEMFKTSRQSEDRPVSVDSFTALEKAASEERNRNNISAGPAFTGPPANFSVAKQIEMNDWVKFRDQEEKKRFDALPIPLQDVEIGTGGVYSENMFMQAMTDSFVDHLTFGLNDGSHPVYGKRHRELNQGAAFTGSLMGELTSFLALSFASGAVGAPAKIASLARKSKAAQQLLKVSGYAPYQLSRYKSVLRSTAELAKGMSKFGAIEAAGAELAGAQAINLGLIRSLGSTVRDLTTRYRKEDQLTKAQWVKSVPAAITGFIEGWGLSVINAPQAWSARFMGDGLYSVAQQNYRMITGQQKQWDNAQFFTDWIVGNFLGEVQAKSFSKISPNQKDNILKDPTRRDYYERINATEEVAKMNVPDYERLKMAEILNMTEQIKFGTEGIRMTKDDRVGAVKTLLLPYSFSHKARIQFNNINTKEIDFSQLTTPFNQAKTQAYDDLATYFKWGTQSRKLAETEDILNDFGKFSKLVPKAVISKELLIKDIEGITINQFKDSLSESYDSAIRLLKEGGLSRPQQKAAKILEKIELEKFLLTKEQFASKTTRNELRDVSKIKPTGEELDIAEQLKEFTIAGFRFKKVVENVLRQKLSGKRKQTDLKELVDDGVMDTYTLAMEKNLDFYVREVRKGNDTTKTLQTLANEVATRVNRGEGFYEGLGREAVSLNEKYETGQEKITLIDESKRIKSPSDNELESLNARYSELQRGLTKDQMAIKSGIVNSKDFARMAETAKQSPLNLLRVMFRYMSTHQHFTREAQKRLLYRFGITDFNENSIGDMIKNVAKVINKIDGKVMKSNPPPSKSYTKQEVRDVFDAFNKKIRKVNPTTGFRTDVNSVIVKQAASDNGLYTISLRSIYNDTLSAYGEVAAKRVIKTAAAVIRDQVELRNADYTKMSQAAKLYARNPAVDNDTQFVFFSQDIPKSEFDQFALDLSNFLKGRYKDIAENDMRKFAVFIEDGTRFGKTLEDFGNITTGYTKSVSDLISSNKEQEKLLDLARILEPNKQEFFENALYDVSRQAIREDINSIFTAIGSRDLEFNDMAAMLNADQALKARVKALVNSLSDNMHKIPDHLPSLIQADVYSRAGELAGIKPKEANGQKAKIKNRTTASNVSEVFIDKHMKTTQRADEVFGEILNVANKNMLRDQSEMANEMQQKATLFDNAYRGSKNFFNSVFKFSKEKFTVFENKNNVEHAQRAIYKLQGGREEIHEKDVMNAMTAIYGPFARDSLKGDGNMTQAFYRIQAFLREEEFKLLVKDTQSYELQPNIIKELKRPINWTNERVFPVDAWIRDPNHMTGAEFFQIKKASLDPLVYSKIVVQHMGVAPEALINFMIKKDQAYFSVINKLYQSNRENLGAYKNFELFEGVKNAQQDEIIRMMRLHGDNKALADSFDFNNPKDMRLLKDMVVGMPVGKARESFVVLIKQYEEFDPNKLSYVSHRVLEDPEGKAMFKGEITKDIEGGRVRGPNTLSPMIDELSGRKAPTLLNLIERGYKVELNSFEVEYATMSYLATKNYNHYMAQGFKQTFATNLIGAYEPIRKLEQRFDEVRDREDIPDFRKQQLLQEIITKKEAKLKDFLEFFSENGGYFYKPVSGEITRAKQQLKEIEEALDVIKKTKSTDEQMLLRLQDNWDLINGRIKAMSGIIEILSGKAAVQEKKQMINLFNKSDDKRLKISVEAKETMKNRVKQEQFDFVNDIANRLIADDVFIPMNGRAHGQDVMARPGSPLDPLVAGVKMEVKRNRIEAPNLPFWDGLYMQRVVAKGLKQYVFRNDFENKQAEYDFINKLRSSYDSTNSFLKIITLVKPTILAANDTVQAAIGIGPTAVKNMGFAKKALLEKFDTNSKEGRFYWLMNKNDLFNKAVGIEGIIKESARAQYRLLGQDKFLGVEKYIKEIFKNDNPDLSDKELKHKVSAWMRNQGGKVVRGFKGWQELAWGLDEYVRLTSAKTMFDKFSKVHGPDRGAFLAAEWTNRHLVQYSRIPAHTRRMLNRFFMFPTFRIGTARMYKDMIKDFGKGVSRIFGANPDNIFRVSDKRLTQALFEMGPLVRSIALKGVAKGFVMSALGFTFEDPFDLITNYRAKRNKNYGDPFDRTLEYIALSTPLFELEKYMTRPLRVTLLFNTAGLPRLFYSLGTNTNPITGRPMWKTPFSVDPRRAGAQLGLEILRTYFPFGSDMSNLSDPDLSLMKKIINTSGMAFFYDTKDGKAALRDFEKSISKASTPQEREAALRTFNKNIKRAYFQLFNEEYKDILDELDELNRLERRR